MPRFNEPKTLKKRSILVIAQHWDRLCYGVTSFTQMNDLIETDEFLSMSGPFQNMPTTLLEDILDTIQSSRSLTRKFLHLLILRQLRALNLGFGSGEIYYGFKFLQRCEHLEKLSLGYLRHIEPTELMKVIPYLQSIVSLNLHMTFTTDSVLAAIGDNCPNLVDLNLISTEISDHGIRRLCGIDQPDKIKKCQQLKRLQIAETRISSVGAICALENFPLLTDFDFDKIFSVFEHLDSSSKTKKNLSLRSLYSTSPCIRSDSIETAAAMCPHAEILSIANAWMDNDTFYKFMVFENLKTLAIVNSDGLTIDYEEGVLPVLLVCGNKLENLILNKFSSLDLFSLAQACPVLKKLALAQIKTYEINEPPFSDSRLFTNLTNLELWADDKTEHNTGPILTKLLSWCINISNILVKKCDAFNTELLTKIWKTNPMEQLNRLHVNECQSFTIDLLNDFIARNNILRVIRIWSCSQITRDHQDHLQQYIKESNLDIYLEWFA